MTPPSPLTSKHRGVSWNKSRKMWQASRNINGKRVYLGSYHKEEEAAAAYRAGVNLAMFRTNPTSSSSSQGGSTSALLVTETHEEWCDRMQVDIL